MSRNGGGEIPRQHRPAVADGDALCGRCGGDVAACGRGDASDCLDHGAGVVPGADRHQPVGELPVDGPSDADPDTVSAASASCCAVIAVALLRVTTGL